MDGHNFCVIRQGQCRLWSKTFLLSLLLFEADIWDAEVKSMVQKEQQPEIPQVQFAEISLPAATNETEKADIVLRCGNWTVEIRNTASGEIVQQVVEQVSRHV